ncbi:proline--tRNA ligase [Paramagnetospirillum kuznetsovii]|uniref:Proline--tRNA ligase n=1 Tax=Paramagnetospirillum kuznetsovii TaxID=2053833 RepID=A0A364NZJ2_9PROT|nr:proline--tRNA ligase [Paramagnetospirillum kuznetsovii]RAU22494.1 proline--tRNA ligase [Paramagnetospirillum kuznetsovii]
MRRSAFFLPTLKETPSEAQIASHRLMLRAGMVRQSAAGIYSWLPLGFKVLRKIEQIVREEQDAAGAQELLMPTIQSADIWRESERYDAYGKEMLRFKDRHDREMLYGPTNEELITQLFRDNVRSYRDLPKILYHIQWKFRDEVRPRFGVMRGREFLMKDSYSFDMDFEGAKRSYEAMFTAYLKTFKRMGLTAIPMQADSGAIGGNLTHEFHVLAETGESGVFYDIAYDDLAAKGEIDLAALNDLYAATDEKHVPGGPNVPPPERLREARGIEVGHIFYFGTKYSKAMNAMVQGKDGEPVFAEMGSYGIGVSRLVGAIIEAYHDDRGIKWPESVAPFKVGLINLKAGDALCDKTCDDIYAKLGAAGVEVLYDDRDDRAGVKFADMDLIGLPWQLIAGPKGLAQGVVELKNRATDEKVELSVDSALARLVG